MRVETKQALPILSLGAVFLVVLWGWGYFIRPSDAMTDRIISVLVFVAGAECVRRSLPDVIRDFSQKMKKRLARLNDVAFWACFFAGIFTTTLTQFIIQIMTLFILLFISGELRHVREEKRLQPGETINYL